MKLIKTFLLTSKLLFLAAMFLDQTRLQAAVGERLSLDGLVSSAAALRDNATRLVTAVPEAARINRALMWMSRALVPINYTSGDRFAHDPALALPAWPTLRPLRELAATVPGSDAAGFLTVGAVRARNCIAHALREANAAAEGACHS